MISEQQLLEAKILIVDDNPTNVLLMEKILGSAGYKNIRSVTDPHEVIEVYKEFQPDLVLLDLRMPDMDGYQIMEQLKEIEQDSYISVLILTAYQEDETRIRALEMGAKDFLTKPMDRLEALTRIRNLLEVRLLHNQSRDQNKILDKEVRKRTWELNRTRLEIIRRLGRAAEYRDNETGLHIIRMSKMAALLGKATGMNEVKCDLLLNTSPMHDIGKIGIPDRILLKPGKFDQEEWDIMKTHTTIGAELLSGQTSDLIESAGIITLTHHEKWDGSGYPNGLKGENIPLEGRICALCDVFDALTSARVYKKRWSSEDALAKIYLDSGKHFDPELTGIFKTIVPEILAIKKEYAEPNMGKE